MINEALFIASNTLSEIAGNAVRQSDAHPDANIVAVIFSVTWLEASINELIYDLLYTPLEQIPSEYIAARYAAEAADLYGRGAPVKKKLRVLCAARTGRPLDPRVKPWHNAMLLIELRNWFAHLRPEKMKVRPGEDHEPSSLVSREVDKLVTKLKQAGAINDIPEGRMVPVAIAARLPGVAKWSYQVTYEVLTSVADWHPQWRNRILLAHRPPDLVIGTA